MHILIIEDDVQFARVLSIHLRHAGFTVDACNDGLSGLTAATQGNYELILLDRMLPGLDGAQVLRRLREQHITMPVLMITAMARIDDRVEGLDAGADDYLVKPFATEELLARVRALGRRTPQLSEPDRLKYGNVTLNEDRGFLQSEDGASCSISKREAGLLAQFIRNPGQTLTRDLLLSRVWGGAQIEGGNLDNFIYFVRKRLKSVKADSKIATVRGLGFRLERL
ncbi:MAG: response regulator transcription factor [Clostridia bacterium]